MNETYKWLVRVGRLCIAGSWKLFSCMSGNNPLTIEQMILLFVAPCMCVEFRVRVPPLASYPGHMGGKSGLVSTVCACAKGPMISWGIVYHRLWTVNLYCIVPKHVCLKLIPRTWQVKKARTLIKRSSFHFVVLEREISRWKQSSWMRSNASTMVKTYSCGYPRDLGSPSATRLPFVSTTSTVTVELAVVVA